MVLEEIQHDVDDLEDRVHDGFCAVSVAWTFAGTTGVGNTGKHKKSRSKKNCCNSGKVAWIRKKSLLLQRGAVDHTLLVKLATRTLGQLKKQV